MSSTRSNVALLSTLVLAAVSVAPSSASSPMTAAQAMASVHFLAGTWHCTGDGTPEDDVYTFHNKVWRDVDSLGGITTGTFDAKRQKWVVFFMNTNGEYGVNEGGPLVGTAMHFTFPYPPSLVGHSFTFKKKSDTAFMLGKQLCVKK